jgi:TrmH family RNA methyltransferase
MTIIQSHSNALVKRIKRLRQKKYRQREGVFFIEGLHVVGSALEQGAAVEQMVWCAELLTSDFGLQLIETAAFPTAQLSRDVFLGISERDNPSGIGAIVRSPLQRLAQLTVEDTSCFVALVAIADPGNLGTIIRTVDASGASGVILVGETTDPMHPTALKASMGAWFGVPLAAVASSEELMTWAQQKQLQVVATSAHAPIDYTQAHYRHPLLLLLGSERHGLSRDVLDAADLAVSIPMAGHASSLNLAVATGLLLYELRRSA